MDKSTFKALGVALDRATPEIVDCLERDLRLAHAFLDLASEEIERRDQQILRILKVVLRLQTIVAGLTNA